MKRRTIKQRGIKQRGIKQRGIKRRTRKGGARKRSAVAGKVMPPLDVRSTSSLKEMEKRIKKGPITLIMVYADWCGHCHEMMPHWDKAAESPERTIQAIKVNEKMVNDMNQSLNSSVNPNAAPIQVSGYPSLLLVDTKANKVTDIEPVKDAKVLSKVMNRGGPIAEEAESMVEENPADVVKSMGRNVQPSEEPAPIISSPTDLQADESVVDESVMEESTNNMRSLPLYQEPLVKNSLSMTPENKVRGGGRKEGGGLYQALSQSAYTLAPAAVLMGVASYIMKPRRSRASLRKTKKQRKTRRRS